MFIILFLNFRVAFRSHSVLTLHIESKITVSSGVEQPDNPEVTSSSARGRSNSRTGRAPTPSAVRSELRLGKIHLVDLAGSERLSESKAQGEIMTETQNINKSLLALGGLKCWSSVRCGNWSFSYFTYSLSCFHVCR